MNAHDMDVSNNHSKSPIKIVSLDCWGTILVSNNETWDECARKIANYFCIHNADAIKNVKTISKKINVEFDKNGSEKLIEYSQYIRVKAIIRALGFKPTKVIIDDIIGIINQVFLSSDIPLELIEPRIATALSILKLHGHHIVLLSNSGLIRGKEMRAILNKLDIATYFDEYFFSDELGIPKPSLLIFEEIIKYANIKGIVCQKNEIIHIGDNRTTDYLPAKKVGFKSLLISDGMSINTKNQTKSICHAVEDGWFGDEVKTHYVKAIKELNETYPDNIKYISKYNLSIDINGELIDEDAQPLDIEVYSEMKYGVKSATKLFARQLAELIYLRMPGLVMNPNPPKFVDSRKILVPASGYISLYVQKYLNQKRSLYNLAPVEIIPVRRQNDTLFDYAALEPHTRKIDIFSDLIFPDIDYNSGPLIVIEDICVSGTFTKKMLQSIREVTTAEVTFVYLIKVNDKIRNNNIHVEPMINSRYIKKLSDIEPFIKRGDFLLTRKYYKMLLSSKIEELNCHLDLIPKKVLYEIVHNLRLSREDIYEFLASLISGTL